MVELEVVEQVFFRCSTSFEGCIYPSYKKIDIFIIWADVFPQLTVYRL